MPPPDPWAAMWHWESKSKIDRDWCRCFLDSVAVQIFAFSIFQAHLCKSSMQLHATWLQQLVRTLVGDSTYNIFKPVSIPTSSTISIHLSCGWNMVSMGALVSPGINSLPASCRGRALEWLDVSPTPCDGHPHGEKPHWVPRTKWPQETMQAGEAYQRSTNNKTILFQRPGVAPFWQVFSFKKLMDQLWIYRDTTR